MCGWTDGWMDGWKMTMGFGKSDVGRVGWDSREELM